jgi:hypothetical protein
VSERKNPLEQALDLFFYAPLGLVLNAREVIPELIEKGHQQVSMARMFGQFALEQEAPKQVAKLQEQASKLQEQAATVVDQLAARAGGRRNGSAPSGVAPRTPSAATPAATPAAPVPAVAGPPAPPVDSLAIPDYDSLSASQVVPRLAALSGSELAAVRDYEGANRGRKTILNRIDQLQAG